MKTAAILGCGYTGKVLARRLIDAGWRVRGTTTREDGVERIKQVGAEPVVARLDDIDSVHEAVEGAQVVFHLAPPPTDGQLEPEIDVLKGALPDDLDAFVYGSTTGAFGQHEGSPWIDEDTPSRDLGARGRRRYDYERALATFVKPLKVVRIAGIYGPGRGPLGRDEAAQLSVVRGRPAHQSYPRRRPRYPAHGHGGAQGTVARHRMR
ncbi:MAG: NAD-dependent epimerase/dehydratase family protein [Myxococcota bacterium]